LGTEYVVMSVCGVNSCEVEDESVLEEKLTIEEQSVTAVQDAHSPYTSFTFFAYLSRCILTCYLIEIGNESVPIQLAQCWFPGLASASAKI